MSDIVDAMNKAKEAKKRVTVNHTGSCNGENFVAGVETELSESTITALGGDVTIIGEAQPAQQVAEPAQEVKEEVSQPTEEVQEENPEQK